jgi:hypothetical protein
MLNNFLPFLLSTMPNRCSNFFTAKSEDVNLIAQVHAAIITKENCLDYNLICPMPKELDLPRTPIDIVPDGTNKLEHVLQQRPYILSDQWLANQKE